MSSPDKITVRGASEHNLKNLDVDIDRGCITVITGVSGSGKSSLAFDTVLAEAQRRFFYTLSHYSRQFLDLGSRPAVRQVGGLSPAIALAQNETQPSRRATVGTQIDVSELLGVVLARFGEQRCPDHDSPTSSLTAEEIVSRLIDENEGQTITICAPIAEKKKGVFRAQFNSFAEKGYLKAWVDGEVLPLTPMPELAREERHTIKLIIDTVKVKRGGERGRLRLLRSVETALKEGAGYGEYFQADSQRHLNLDQGGTFASTGGCPQCGYSWPRLDARYFSANSLGKCKKCNGLGIRGKAEDEREAIDTSIMKERTGLTELCGECDGTGLNPLYDAIRINNFSARDLQKMPIVELQREFANVRETMESNPAIRRVTEEIEGALKRVVDVGLPYLSLARRIRSLSGGELQRLKLAGILGENLRGVLYVLDEPSQGLHPSELDKLWVALERLKHAGNTVVIVDHDATLMERADWIIDLGPGGGARGGRLMARFQPKDAKRYTKSSVTAQHLVARETMAPLPPRQEKDETIRIEGAALNNLQLPEVRFPINGLTVVTGVSGAGKSSLVLATLYPNLADAAQKKAKRSRAKPKWRNCTTVSGYDDYETVVLVDRRPIAKSSVSMPASYLGIFTDLRTLYASLPEAQVAGLTARSFSLSVEGGRCPECKGRGEVSLSMRFLADARVRCPVCAGHRYRPHALDVRYAGLNMTEVLELTLDEAAEHFKNHRKIVKRLAPALELGMGYLKMGQPSSSLSGGEAQRLKLVPHLSRRHGDASLLILDEPTTGLHFEDVQRLLVVLRRLVESGATVVLIEHNGDVIRAADWVIDLGPGAAANGGRLVYEGPPAGLPKAKHSVTAQYL